MAYIPVASGVAKLLKSWDLQPHGIFADGGRGGSVPTEEKKKSWDLRKLGNIRKVSRLHRMIAQCPVPLPK